jgi:hypothetical protein
VPAIPPYIIEPIWQQFRALLPSRETNHPLGCHRPRIPDHVVFEKLVQILVFGCAYWRIADEGCSATTLRRRRRRVDRSRRDGRVGRDGARVLRPSRRPGALRGGGGLLHPEKAPCGGEKAGRSPVDRGKRGMKRSVAVDAEGIPLGAVAAPANRHDSPLLAPTLGALETLAVPGWVSVHLDRGYDSKATRRLLEDRGLVGVISEKGKPSPLGATKRWVIERTNSWSNAHKKLVWCTERRGRVIDFWVAFSNVLIIVGRLIREAWSRYRWEGRPSRRP